MKRLTMEEDTGTIMDNGLQTTDYFFLGGDVRKLFMASRR